MSHCVHAIRSTVHVHVYFGVFFQVGDGNEERDRYSCGHTWKNTGSYE